VRRILTLAGAAGVLVSGYVHYYLYFEGGYRGIAPDEVLGLTISRAFAINAIAGFLIAWALVSSLVWERLTVPAALAGAGFAAATLVAYGLTRTTGLLGFDDDQTSTEAVIAVVAEVVALVSLSTLLTTTATTRPRTRAAPVTGSP
jgi:hypothetical protein